MRPTFCFAIVICAVLGLAIADYRDDALKLHNRYPPKHHAPKLALCDRLNASAEKYAKKMARDNHFDHSGQDIGENIFEMSAGTDEQVIAAAVNSWYNESSKYNYNNGGFSMKTGHFTQLVWKSSELLGIGIGRSKHGVFVCAHYDPRGNVGGQFKQNVLRP